MAMDLEIERLALTGLELPGDAAEHVRRAVAAELTRLLALHGLPAGLADAIPAASVAAPALHVTPGMAPSAIGAELAHAIYRALLRLT